MLNGLLMGLYDWNEERFQAKLALTTLRFVELSMYLSFHIQRNSLILSLKCWHMMLCIEQNYFKVTSM